MIISQKAMTKTIKEDFLNESWNDKKQVMCKVEKV